ncbi:MAG: chemotaxis protein [Burkholderiales bacterium]|nr:chemotaxis protein [Burkholderiales bacterium]MDE1928214.1 chemotaxis protein [Burkholderiales bacterium]MDE2157449.1 chemotaxis protein [Burkholderiales bacterium]MDE2501575.1 chemotaxis protein [Burkholderiales bacterium]
MLKSLFRKDPVVVVAAAAAEPSNDAHYLRSAIESIGAQSSNMGREAAEVRGQMEDAHKVSTQQGRTLASLAHKVGRITQAQDAISAASQGSAVAVGRARNAVEQVGAGVSAILATLRQVSSAADSITGIALQTRLVAFNASVEAKRAGDAGRGFGVVANAVKDLAGQVESSSKAIASTVADLDERIGALAREIRVDDGAAADRASGFQAALLEMQQGVARMSEAAARSRDICGELNAEMGGAQQEMTRAGAALGQALERSESFLRVSENLIDLLSNCGIRTAETPYIEAAQDAARRIAEALEAALARGAITLADLYDEQYVPIPGTNPPQHRTKFVAIADELFPAVQEPVLELSTKVAFCIAVDRNGYVAMHNRKYSQPQRGDLAWDTAHSRYRRIFDDRTGLTSARNERPFLVQTYRRDMGAGQYVVLKEVAAPIVVRGRHWGAIRLGFNF